MFGLLYSSPSLSSFYLSSFCLPLSRREPLLLLPHLASLSLAVNLSPSSLAMNHLLKLLSTSVNSASNRTSADYDLLLYSKASNGARLSLSLSLQRSPHFLSPASSLPVAAVVESSPSQQTIRSERRTVPVTSFDASIAGVFWPISRCEEQVGEELMWVGGS
ncbi:unnamed protein product [Microthlaspi erraticum]|uniref:Uncharacterized protein n=1 Tax=Microthlaspi erraticum TaxID=1685480 RepID=A0A6D2I1P7_9BRAS|nr:unnamed protein product [Microthlaspi erraticum]CAA7050311.1 unnamed protein product [Microthlaspi erraticum]